jgi:hypothetical protein
MVRYAVPGPFITTHTYILLAKSAITIGLIARDLTSSAKWLAYLAFIVTGYLAFIDSPIPHLSTRAIPHFLTGLRRTRQVPGAAQMGKIIHLSLQHIFISVRNVRLSPLFTKLHVDFECRSVLWSCKSRDLKRVLGNEIRSIDVESHFAIEPGLSLVYDSCLGFH